MSLSAYEIKISGIVQGVGFRPFIYNLAVSLHIKGWVGNSDSSVLIRAEGCSRKLQEFVQKIRDGAPPLSLIKEIEIKEIPYEGFEDFKIIKSSKGSGKDTYISPDVSVCRDCINELFHKDNPRYLYPFINCTNCGPRFTIVKSVPYDREFTTMDKFCMCPMCRQEYDNPEDRRYHAQPVSCYNCGPELVLLNSDGENIDTGDVIEYVCDMLKKGKIIAVKGLGGYHLACDAGSRNAVQSLRQRKLRDKKPFAVMVKDYNTALKYCYINEEEKRLLESPQKPIVLLKRRHGAGLPEDIAPKNPYLGVMLPYTPVHLLLFHKSETDVMVMTSGNRSSEPIYYKDGEALENLKGIADYFLLNNREIYIRTDDSVTRAFMGREYIIRRSRGYVPMPVTWKNAGRELPSVLACGGELKNTFCLNKGNEFYLSHHIGDLENVQTLDSFEEGIEHFRRMFNVNYQIVAHDLHPEYLSTKYAYALDRVQKTGIQHHHAHIASCMAENNLDGEVIGVAFDGTGFGLDGNIWGGEFFAGGYKSFKRAGYFEYVRMPGGEMAVKEPWRMALSYLLGIYGDIYGTIDYKGGINIDGVRLFEGVKPENIRTVAQITQKGLNSPLTSSAGRMFDAVSALLGFEGRIDFEGQAAIELEYLADDLHQGGYSYLIDESEGVLKVNISPAIKEIIKDLSYKVNKSIIASRFHETIACVVLECCMRIRGGTGLNRVVLSGGVFQNMKLLESCVLKLRKHGFSVYTHSTIPANDGGVALGQAVIAALNHL